MVTNLTLMKNVLIPSLLFALVLVSTKVIAGTITSDNLTPKPIKTENPQEEVKKVSEDKYNFTLFNFFGAFSIGKADSSATKVIESKEPKAVLRSGT